MVPLFLLSVVSVTLCLERVWFWHVLHLRARQTQLAKLAAALRANDTATLKPLVAKERSVFEILAKRLLFERHNREGVAIEVVEDVRGRIARFMPILSTIITAAPLIGILGTVTGIIQSFELLGESQMVTDPREVSAGIAQALITTAAGLIVSLITLFPYMLFRANIDRVLGQLDVIIGSIGDSATPESGLTKKSSPNAKSDSSAGS